MSTKHGDKIIEVNSRQGGSRQNLSAICTYNAAKSFMVISDLTQHHYKEQSLLIQHHYKEQ